MSHHQRKIVWDLLQELSKTEGSDQVFIVKKTYEATLADFKWKSSFNVEVKAYVYERIARKYADKYRKEK